MKKYNWAILGSGNIAREMAIALQEVNGQIYAVGNIHLEKAQEFADEFQIENVYGDCDNMKWKICKNMLQIKLVMISFA